MTERFRDRREAGIALAAAVARLHDAYPVVLALPRGGVPVAFEVARVLEAPLDVIVVRKLGVPDQPELGMGAIGEGGVRVIDQASVRLARVTPDQIEAAEVRERVELERRLRRYRDSQPMVPLAGRTAVVVDDGIATGGTARAALQIARLHGAQRVVLAVPVAPPEVFGALAGAADEIVVVRTPSPFIAIGKWYENFAQTTDEEVRGLLATSRRTEAERAPRPDRDGLV